MTETLYPTYGKVWLTDRAPYDDASDHNLLQVSMHLDATTTAQVATFNVRLKSMDAVSVSWATRRHRAAKVIADSTCSVLAMQECEAVQASYLVPKVSELTGDPWKLVRPTNVCFMYKSDRWRLLAERRLIMDNGAEADRRFLAILLQSVKTGQAFWFTNCHLGVGIPLASWRRHQARKMIEQLKLTPRKDSESHIPAELFGDIRNRAVVMGDFNDWAQHASTGVRQVFAEAGMFEQRVHLSDADFAGDTWRTNHGFRKATLRDSRQIDAVFTAR
jgi:endonuclease/exonuclease/phosphatase family metal-dependent hydrolase